MGFIEKFVVRVIRDGVTDPMTRSGFRNHSEYHFLRENEGSTSFLSFQIARIRPLGTGRYRLVVGQDFDGLLSLYPPSVSKQKPTEAAGCVLSKPMNLLTDNVGWHWWTVDKESAVEEHVNRVLESIQKVALPWFHACESPEKALEILQKSESEHLLLRPALGLLAGKRELAIELLNSEFVQWGNDSNLRKSIVAFAEKNDIPLANNAGKATIH